MTDLTDDQLIAIRDQHITDEGFSIVACLRACYVAGKAAVASPAVSAPAVDVERDAARYRWMRIGDNDERVMRTYDREVPGRNRAFDPARDFSWLLRDSALDGAVDAAMQTGISAPVTQDGERAAMTPNEVRDGIADFVADTWPDRKHTLAEIESGIRSIEITPKVRA